MNCPTCGKEAEKMFISRRDYPGGSRTTYFERFWCHHCGNGGKCIDSPLTKEGYEKALAEISK